MKRFFGHSSPSVLIALMTANALAGEPASTENPLEATRYGEAVYSLYVDDPITSMSRIAKARVEGISELQRDSLTLLEGGLALGYGMPKQAELNLNQRVSEHNRHPLAYYWLARLNFSQNRNEAGLEAYQAFLTSLAQGNLDIEEVVTPAQWYQLNYESAQAGTILDVEQSTDYESTIPAQHITRQYLAYNRAVAAFSEGEAFDAIAGFSNIETTLSKQLTQYKNSDDPSFWLGWWTELSDNTVSKDEIEGLLNQTYMSHGQVLLAQGRFTDALDVFARIGGQSIVRDEALLQYGWGLARKDDWPMAMGVWDYLASQPVNLYTLQANHALALGYAREGGEVQASDSLTQLVTHIDGTLADLNALQANMSKPDFWHGLASGLNRLATDLNIDQQQQLWTSDWPASHQDLLMELMLSDDTQQDLLSQLEELYGLKAQLNERLDTLDTYLALLDERDAVHTQRASAYQGNPTDIRLQALKSVADSLNVKAQQAHQTLNEMSSNEDYLSALATYASQPQLDWLQRLNRGEKRFERLSESRNMKASYAQRLARLKGILLWQLAEQSVKGHWQLQQALATVETLLEKANQRQAHFEYLLADGNVTAPQRMKVNELTERVDEQLAKTQSLINELETQLNEQTHEAIAQRRHYLQQQQSRSKLALLQLNDRWRASVTVVADGHSKQEESVND